MRDCDECSLAQDSDIECVSGNAHQTRFKCAQFSPINKIFCQNLGGHFDTRTNSQVK